MAGYSQADLDAVADQLNGRPRQTLGWKTPSQTLEQALR
jgi:IS30 family transposase